MKKIITMTLLLYSITSLAEYRVYQYVIKNKGSYQDKDVTYNVLSTLNPVSYKAYHGGASNIQIDLLRTWICPGHTGNKQDYCPSPYEDMMKNGVNNGASQRVP
jgi:hypothetical protein